jgi:hypothetical protein
VNAAEAQSLPKPNRIIPLSDLRWDATNLMGVVANIPLEKRLLRKATTGDREDGKPR